MSPLGSGIMIACKEDITGMNWWFDKTQATQFTPVIYGNQKHTPILTGPGNWVLRTQSKEVPGPVDPFLLLTEQDMTAWAVKAEADDVLQVIGSGVALYKK